MATQINQLFVSQLKTVLKILTVSVFCVGFLALTGWLFDIPALKQVWPNLPVISPNTALLFVFLSLSLFFIAEEKSAQKFQFMIGLFSLIIFSTGFLTLMEYLLAVNFGIDNLFFAGKTAGAIIRMSPQSALNFSLIGVLLFLMLQKNKRSIFFGQIIILITGIISLVSLFGFIYNVTSFYTISPYKGIALPTAAAFAMIFTILFAIHPEIGLMKIFSQKNLSSLAARRLFLTLIFLIILESMIMLGQQKGMYNRAYESLFHFLTIIGVFVFLIFYVFRSLDKLAGAERKVAHIRIIDKAKTEFVSLASHQLRTPLTAISWYTELLNNKKIGELNEKQKACAEKIYSGNRRMINLVNDILNASRIDIGTLVLDQKPTDLVKLTKNALKEIEPFITEKKMKVSEDYEKSLPKIMTDPEMIRSVFQNLLSNALKYTPEKGKISIEIKRRDSHILAAISDNGLGIPEHQKNSIFTKMFRADNVRSKGTTGTGLGLYIARAIIKKSGGKIWFESRENKGTTFYFTLPISASTKNLK